MFDLLLKFLDSQEIQRAVEMWLDAINNPQQFLAPAFQPTKEQFVMSLEFYFKMVVVSLLIYAIVAFFVGRGSFAIRFMMLANGLLGIITFFVVAMAVHVPFWFLGGKASFMGTCMAYIYAGGPYAPFLAIAQWIMVSGMPPGLRRYALNPTTAQQAGHAAATHPDTAKGIFFMGSFIVLGLVLWTSIVSFRCLGFVHDLGGWWFALAIVLSLIVSVPISAVVKRMASLPFEGDEPAKATP